MSISKVHELLQNKGCVWTVSILTILGFIASSFALQCNHGPQGGGMGEMPPGNPVAQVGSAVITDNVLTELIQGADQQNPTSPGEDALTQATHLLDNRVSALNNLIGDACLTEIAEKHNVTVSDEDVVKQMESNIQSSLAGIKMQLVAMKKLNEGATDEEFNKVYKELTGKDPQEMKEQTLATLRQRLQNKDTRMSTVAEALSQPLAEALKKEITISDDDLKKSFDSFEFKRIFIDKGDVADLAKKAEADIKGGMSFENAINRYSTATPPQGKKLSEETQAFKRSELESIPSMKPLVDLKPGQVSEPIQTGQSLSIYKLVSIKSDVPKDFDKKKDELRDTALTQKAYGKLKDELDAKRKEIKIDWKNDAYKVVYEYGRIDKETVQGKKQRSELLQLMKDARTATETGTGEGSRDAVLVAFVTLEGLSQNASPDEQKALDEDRAPIYEDYLQNYEDPDLRLKLATIYMKQKDGGKLADELTSAASANANRLDALGQSTYNQINKILQQAQDAKLLDEKQVQSIEDSQRSWVDMKTEQDKMDAEQKKQEEERQKELKQEEEKLKQEDAKKKADAAKTPSAPKAPAGKGK